MSVANDDPRAAQDRRQFLMHSTAGVATAALGVAFASQSSGLAVCAETQHQQAGPAIDKSASEILAERAVRFREMILDVAFGPGGMIVAFVRYDTRRPFQESEELPPYLSTILHNAWGDSTAKPTVADWLYGENTLWATGLLLWSQILRYRATREAEALHTARKCFRDLNHIFRLSRTLEPGLLGKPHGGGAGATTSFDQSACPVLFYVMFAKELATPEEKAEAVENMAQHGEYYLRHKWVMNHHGKLAKVVDRCHTSTMKYLACMYAAYDLTGQTKYRDTAIHYLRQIIKDKRLPWPTTPAETNHNLFYWAYLCDYFSKTELAGEFDWIGCIREYWQAMQAAVDHERLLRQGTYHTAERSFTPYPDRWMNSEGAQAKSTGALKQDRKSWQSSTCYPNRALSSAFAAALAHLASSHGLEDKVEAFATRSLLRLDESNVRWWWDDGKLPEELKPMMNIFGPEVPAAWLVAYWMGRNQGLWQPTK